MFIHKYIDDFYFGLIMLNYDLEYLNNLDESNFIKIYNLFKKYNFYFINDIILDYLEIFSMDYNIVNQNILNLKEKLGTDFVSIIGKNMTYLNEIKNI